MEVDEPPTKADDELNKPMLVVVVVIVLVVVELELTDEDKVLVVELLDEATQTAVWSLQQSP